MVIVRKHIGVIPYYIVFNTLHFIIFV